MEIIIANRYHLGKKLGEGGFSEVFEATDARSKDKCALKLEQRTSPVADNASDADDVSGDEVFA